MKKRTSKILVTVKRVRPKGCENFKTSFREGNILFGDRTPEDVYREYGGGEEFQHALDAKSKRIADSLFSV